MVAEDDPVLHLDLTQELTSAGYRVSGAGNGDEAIWQARRFGQSFAAAILDVGLGRGPSGFDVARFLRAEAPALPIVFTTAHEAARQMAEELQPALHVEKPYRVEQITEALAQLLT